MTATDRNHGAISGTIKASAEQPIENLAFCIDKWGTTPAIVKINGKSISNKNYRCGYEKTLEGTKLIVYVELIKTTPFEIKIENK